MKNVPISVGTGPSIATDEIAGVHYQLVKQGFGVDGTATMVSSVNPLPVTVGASLAVTGQFYQATQPVSISGTVPVSGSFYQATQPVSIAAMPSTPVTGTFWPATQPVSGSVSVAGSVAVTGAFYQSTQPVSAATLPLPAGASTETTLAALNTKTPSLGQALMASSQPVAIASNQSALPVTGTFWQATQPVSGSVTATPTTPTPFNVSSAASTNLASVKASAGTLFVLAVSNSGAAAAFVKLYNKASAPVVATDIPALTIPVPASGVVSLNLGETGQRFSNGIALAITNLVADTDATAVALNQVKVMASYI